MSDTIGRDELQLKEAVLAAASLMKDDSPEQREGYCKALIDTLSSEYPEEEMRIFIHEKLEPSVRDILGIPQRLLPR